MSTLKANTLSNVAGSQSIPVDRVAQGTAAAWVNFNGTGTVAIRASYNVSSITDNGVGDYTVNFTNNIADANYAAVGFCSYSSGAGTYGFGPRAADVPFATNLLRVLSHYGGVAADVAFAGVAVFR